MSAAAAQSVVIIGAGAVGSLYGARMHQAGHSVTFIMRSDFEHCRQNGLRLISCDGDLTIPAAELKVARSADGLPPADWIIYTLKAYDLKEHAIKLAGSALGPQTKVLAITNGLIDDDLRSIFGCERVFGAVAMVCVSRQSAGVIEHVKHSKLLIGHLQDAPEALAAAAELWSGVPGVEIELTPCLLHSRWQKLLVNASVSGLTVALGGVSMHLLGLDDDLRALTTCIMQEVSPERSSTCVPQTTSSHAAACV